MIGRGGGRLAPGPPPGTVEGRNYAFLPGRLLPFAGSGRPGFLLLYRCASAAEGGRAAPDAVAGSAVMAGGPGRRKNRLID
jgi:hypothetical protein